MDELVEVLSSCRKIALSMRNILEAETKEHALTVHQLIILQVLQEAQSRINMSVLQRQLGLSSASTSTLVDRLVRKGYIEREYSESDRRRVLLSLTDEGNATTKHIFSANSMLMQKLAHLFALPLHDRADLLRIHQKIINNCTEMGGIEQK